MKNLLEVAKVGVVRVGLTATVMEAVEAMSSAAVGAVVVLDGPDGEDLKGIFTERDLMLRVVRQKLDSGTTLVKDVMTSPVTSVATATANPDDLLRMMSEKNIRHLPLVAKDGRVEGIISMRHLLRRKVEHLTREVDSLEAYMSADGIGG